MNRGVHLRVVLVLCLGLFLVALMYRSINLDTPFWVDEFSSARQAHLYQKYGIGVFAAPEFVEHHNVTTYSLIALSFSIFGSSEWSARIPSVIIGSLVPVAVFLLGKKLFRMRVGFVGALLTLCSYVEITWSRQARGYMLQQLLLITLIYAIWMWIHEQKSSPKSAWFAVSIIASVLGILTHSLFVLPLAAIGIWMSLVYLRDFKTLRIRPIPWISVSLVGVIAIFLGIRSQLIETIQTGLVGFSPHLGYYHSFLWREYGVIVVLSVIGVLLGWGKYRRAFALFLSIIAAVLFFVGFIFQSSDTRYVFLFFPWMLFLFVGIASERIALAATARPLLRLLIVLMFPVMLIANGHKFVFKPKPYYSVNHDFREIALIDYNLLYATIANLGGNDPEVAVIETWSDRLLWYMPQIGDRGALFRWKAAGPMRNTNTYRDEKGVHREVSSRLRYIGSLDDLLLLQAQFSRGVLWIDDTSLPRDVVDYAEANMKKELTLDHYPLDDNPYSIWPGTLYSWGMDDKIFALRDL